MAMGFVSEDIFEKELEKRGTISSVISNGYNPARISDVEIKEITRGRGEKKEVPEKIRALIAEESICGANVEEVSKDFNISPSSISAYKNDATSTASYHKPNDNLKKSNDSVRGEIQGKAFKKLMHAIDCLTEEKLSSAKLRDASSIARDLSSIIKNTTSEADSYRGVQANIVVFAPRFKDEDAYEVIDIQQQEEKGL